MIQTKEKKCKGTGKASGNGCGAMTLFRKYGLCQTCFKNWLLNTEAGKEMISRTALKSSVKVKKEKKQEATKEKREQKEKYTTWRLKLQEKINEIVRLIDIGQPCLARGYHPNQIHAGHIYSRGSSPSLKFNLHNIHRQSAQSNHFQNEDGLLREGLVNEYGNDYLAFVSSLRRIEALKYSNEEYHAFYKKALVIVKQLKVGGKNNDINARIDIRNRLNLALGIYDDEFCVFKY